MAEGSGKQGVANAPERSEGRVGITRAEYQQHLLN